MSVSILFLGCFILYGRSRFLPEHLTPLGNIINQKKRTALLIGYLFLMVSYMSFSYQYGWGTGFVIYLISLCFSYGLMIGAFTLHKGYIYLIALLCFVLILFENIIM